MTSLFALRLNVKQSIWPMGSYQVLSLRARVDLGAMAIKGCTAFSKTLASLEPYHKIFWVISRTHVGVVLSLCRSAVGVFYSPSWLSSQKLLDWSLTSLVSYPGPFLWVLTPVQKFISQNSGITGALPSNCLISNPGHSLGRGSYLSAEMQSVDPTVPAD